MAEQWIEQLDRRNRTSKTKRLFIDGQPTNKYSWDGAVGASMHYKDGLGTWQDVDVNAEEPDGDGFTVKFTKLSYFGRIDGEGRRRFYPDRNDLSYWIEFKKPYPRMGAPTRQDRWFYWNFAHAVIGVRFDVDSLKFSFRLKRAQAPTSITIPFETQGITRVGRLLYHDGEVVAGLRRPIATGSNLDADGFPAQKECGVVFAPGEVTISLDPSGLEYPIDIDPTVDKQVGAGADDGWTWGTTFDNTSAYMGAGNANNNVNDCYARFTGISGLSGATIDVAYIEYYEYSSTAGALTKLFAEDAAAPTQIVSAVDQAGRARTTAGIDWDGDLDPGWNESPSIVLVIQELADDHNPTVIQILDDDDGSSQSGTNRHLVRTQEYSDNSYGAKLHIEYSEAAAAVGFGIVV